VPRCEGDPLHVKGADQLFLLSHVRPGEGEAQLLHPLATPHGAASRTVDDALRLCRWWFVG
jgi:hypothetical protein